PIDKGGKQVLNLAQRNDAIELTWLCDLLALTAKLPPWAFFAHALFNHFAQKSPIVREEARVNVFAQTWTPRLHSLPQSLQWITKAARKYNLNLEALFYASKTLDAFPVWFHIGADEIISKQNNTHAANCLRTHHKVTTVGQLQKIANHDMSGHADSQFCNCSKCIEDGIHLGCAHPNNCWKHAIQILNHLHPKWNP
ncbi:hypothetical protein L208DRAFT_1225173, partial [Tricholoma matsutake]